MTETVIYRGPSGTTIDVTALEEVLEQQDMALRVERDLSHGTYRLEGKGVWEMRKATDPSDDPCHAEILSSPGGRIPGVVLDSEDFLVGELVEGTARLLHRVLPEPSKVIGNMSDQQDA
jgi:hypothetical protein